MDCGNKRREPPPPSADRSHYNGADCQKKYVRQSCQEIFALDIPFIELLITPGSQRVTEHWLKNHTPPTYIQCSVQTNL